MAYIKYTLVDTDKGRINEILYNTDVPQEVLERYDAQVDGTTFSHNNPLTVGKGQKASMFYIPSTGEVNWELESRKLTIEEKVEDLQQAVASILGGSA